MEKITREIENIHYEVVLTDDLIKTIADLQEGHSAPNLMLKEWIRLLGKVQRRITPYCEPNEANEVLKMITEINIMIDLLEQLGAPE